MLMMLGEMALAENEVGMSLGTKQQQQQKHSSDIFIIQTNNHSILTILISSLCENSIRTFTHFRVSRHIDGVSCVFFKID